MNWKLNRRNGLDALLAATLLTQLAIAQPLPDELQSRIGRVTGDAPTSQPATPAAGEVVPALSANELETCIVDLLPFMGAATLTDREPGQQAFERIAAAISAPGQEKVRAAFNKAAARQLSPKSPLPARLWILRQLGIVGGPECFPEIADCLKDADPLVREATRRAMQRMNLPECLNALSNAMLTAADDGEKAALVNSLAEFDPPPVHILAPLWQHENEQIALAAIHALGRCQGIESNVPLFALYKNTEVTPEKKLAVQTAILRLSEVYRAAGDREQASKIHKLIQGSPAFPPIRAALLQGRLSIMGGDYVPDLFALVESKDADLLRKTAARMLSEFQGKLGERVAKRLMKADASAQVLYLEVLADRGEAEPIPVIEALLITATDASVQAAAIAALGRLGGDKQAATLARHAARDDKAIQSAARTALIELRGESTNAKLLELAKVGAAAERAECIRAIEKRACDKPIDDLLKLANDAESAVAKAAFDALAALGSDADAPRVLAALIAAPDEVAAKAESAFAKLALRNADVEKRAEPVLLALANAEASAQPRLIRVLARLGGASALAAIRKAAASSDQAVLDAGVRGLSDWTSAEVLDDLKVIADSAKSQSHRVLALRGLVRLLRLPSDRTADESVRWIETAMELAAPLNEKKLVLSAVGEVKHAKSLALARALLSDDALAPEAAVAALSVARGLAVSDPAAAAATIVDVRGNQKCGAAAAQSADDLAKFLESRRGFLGQWEFSGPWSIKDEKVAQVYDTVFAPEPGTPTTTQVAAPATTDWRPLSAHSADDPWLFDLTKVSKDRNCCIYARTTVRVKDGGPATLELGSDDGVMVWLNGKLIHSYKSARSLKVGDDKLSIALQPGENTLLIKVVQGDGGWGFCAALKTAQGEPLQLE